MPKKPKDFTVVGKTKKGVLKIHQNEGLLSSEFCEAVRKLGRWPRIRKENEIVIK